MGMGPPKGGEYFCVVPCHHPLREQALTRLREQPRLGKLASLGTVQCHLRQAGKDGSKEALQASSLLLQASIVHAFTFCLSRT